MDVAVPDKFETKWCTVCGLQLSNRDIDKYFGRVQINLEKYKDVERLQYEDDEYSF